MSVAQNHLSKCADFVRDALVLADGSVFSIQAGNGLAYSTPQEGDGPYTAVEVATSRPILAFARYLDSGEEGFHVHGYVPVALVDQEISARGGVDFTQRGMHEPVFSKQDRAAALASFADTMKG